MPHVHSVASTIIVGVGARYEDKKQAGISHFLEHVFFKGTKNFPRPGDLSKYIDSLGGHDNAATGQEFTYFYNFLPKNYWKEGIGYLAEIMGNPLFDAQELEKEKGVINQEINMYLDDPAQYVHELMFNLMWPDLPLGRSILGNRESLDKIKRDAVLQFINKHYTASNMLLCVAGKVRHESVVKEAEDKFNFLPVGGKMNFAKAKRVADKKLAVYHKKTDQAHLSLAVKALEYGHKEELALFVLNAVLGAGASSRLFLNIREEKGLAYSIYSFVEKYRDTGLFGIGAGVAIDKIKEVVGEILKELESVRRNGIAAEELARIKQFLKGRLELQMDESEKLMAWYGFQGLFYPVMMTPIEKLRMVNKVSQDDIIKLARKILTPKNIKLAVIGPYGKKEEKELLKLIK